MSQPLPMAVITEQLDRLATNYPRTRGAVPLPKLAELWRDNVLGVPPDALRAAVTTILREDQYFPKLARVLEIARPIAAKHQVRRNDMDPLFCIGCGQRSRWESRWRPKIDAKGQNIYDDRCRLALETFERYQCDCSAPSQWIADSADDPWMSPRAPRTGAA